MTDCGIDRINRIDLHHHVVPAFYREALLAQGLAAPGGIPLVEWDVESALAAMDEAGIEVGLASVSYPGVHFGDDAAAAYLARRCNEFSAELVREHPGRFGAFAVLPLPDVDAALDELDHALGPLDLDGVVLLANQGGVYLGDSRFDPVFEQLQARRAVVFVHPAATPDAVAHSLGLPDFLVDFVTDTTRAVATLHYSGTFARTPDVTYVFAHGGGTAPYIANRFALLDRLAIMPGHASRPSALATFRRLYWDTALSWTRPVIQLLQQVVGTSQIVYGSDYPFAPAAVAVEASRALADADYLTAADRAAIERGNALRFLPRLAARTATLIGSVGPSLGVERGLE